MPLVDMEAKADEWITALGSPRAALIHALSFLHGTDLAINTRFLGSVSFGLVRGGCWPDLKEEEPRAPKPPSPVIPEFEPGTENPL